MSSESRPFLPYGRQTITEDDISAVEAVLRSAFLTQGPKVQAFEQMVAAKVNARYGVAVNSATSALHIACLALGLGRHNQVHQPGTASKLLSLPSSLSSDQGIPPGGGGPSTWSGTLVTE